MLVDVVLMRDGGKKLPAAKIKAATPIRGRLSIKTRLDQVSPSMSAPSVSVTFAYLFDYLEDDPIAPPLMELREAHVNALDESGFVIVGRESDGLAQAWWCRPSVLKR